MTTYDPQVREASKAPAVAPGGLDVLMVAEGSYPYQPGGVSVWCDQLISGMPEHRFTVVALTVDKTERSTWPAPPNLTRVVRLPLWGAPPKAGRYRGTPPKWFVEAHETFLRALTQPPEANPLRALDTRDEFLVALHAMHQYAREGDLGRALLSNDAVARLVDAWHESPHHTPLTLDDALTAADLVEHMLRVLSYPPLRADVCHLSMNGLSTLVGMTSKWAHGTRLVMSEHGLYLRERYLAMAEEPGSPAVKLLLLNFFRALAAAAYRVVDVLTPHSNHNRRWQLYNGAEPANVRTMYNGIDPAGFPAATSEPEVPTIVFCGRIDPLKDLHTLIRAFALVRKEVPNARLRMFGPVTAANQPYHASCVALVEELGLTGVAVFEGRIPDQADAYRAGHLVALTSVSEGFPFTVLESMAVGRPPVCTNVGGVSEAVGDAGFVVPPRNHEAVAEACLRLLADEPLRRRLGRAARQRVLDNFTVQQWNDAYRSLYAELAGRP
jgi:glycosyltransferase involved in cell wall biosynthesis